jgi:hypothetical protein
MAIERAVTFIGKVFASVYLERRARRRPSSIVLFSRCLAHVGVVLWSILVLVSNQRASSSKQESLFEPAENFSIVSCKGESSSARTCGFKEEQRRYKALEA